MDSGNERWKWSYEFLVVTKSHHMISWFEGANKAVGLESVRNHRDGELALHFLIPQCPLHLTQIPFSFTGSDTGLGFLRFSGKAGGGGVWVRWNLTRKSRHISRLQASIELNGPAMMEATCLPDQTHYLSIKSSTARQLPIHQALHRGDITNSWARCVSEENYTIRAPEYFKN